MKAIEEQAGTHLGPRGEARAMKLRRMIRMATLAWGVYRTYRRYRGSVRAGTKTALKRARRAL